ncbi:sulfite reductase hemoprotein beta-component [Glycocaulis alkaliphilus]|uniref:Sulfite reductase hemoprotein beta-component n=1 Tax=Glycocaulis alkaliphilus TaxID=1434191 RepID=A0A3T0EAE0_9PROT|nr:nitrite/sulfite reductase [Glycocaulis alkaliphilus]AZU04435.1 sulfite reductase hemoprotein beta-component [Glycocaulis alkaliphilus]GGB78356.1 sulfite reductase [Glycocaulis alkaliphilus]
MYRYDEIDRSIVTERVEEFREQVSARLSGALTEDQFKPLRLMNGVYLQLHAYMLRVAIPYGTLDARQMRVLAHIARHYDKGYGHFTTRQNIQYNWPALVDIPEILEQLADVEMHAIQTSGNCIRNTTTDPFAGAAQDEVEDPRPWCELIRQWSTFHPEFTFLPRKFKIAVTGSDADRAAIGVHDIGLKLVKNEAGETGFEVHAGGGQGRTPRVAVKLRDFLPKGELLAYLTAIMRVYNLAGQRDNIYKARIKILVETMGAQAFTAEVEAMYRQLRGRDLAVPAEEAARITSFFPEPSPVDRPEGVSDAPGFARWRAINVKPHKVPGRAIVVISLKPRAGSPGDATAEQMDAVAFLAERYADGEIRVTKEQNLVIPHAVAAHLPAIYEGLREAGLSTANAGLASDIVTCPGLDYCSLANARSIPVAQALSAALIDRGLDEDTQDLTIKISGCINACGHHHIANIGLLGVDKKGDEVYQLTLGGVADNGAAIGKILGPGLTPDEAVEAVAACVGVFRRERGDDETFTHTLARIGFEPFKEAVYGQ